MTDLIGFAYAAVVAVGGVIGYVKAGSVMSLGAGLLFGALAAMGASHASSNPGNCHLILGASLTLTCVMGYRFMGSGKFMPAGLVALLSVLMVVRYGMRLL
ncbi:transmembrane protein 14C-like [Amphiura filiformis]|uniref:transmembrane protein 14C-like n=1 Tax=Amphiura filiformis TaxID=82378 RepID=UPI003B228442